MSEPVRKRRTAKQAEGWKRALERHREVQRQIQENALTMRWRMQMIPL